MSRWRRYLCVCRVCSIDGHSPKSPSISKLTLERTGMKCLSVSKASTPEKNHVLHDWHAEIVAIRALNAFLLEETYSLASSPVSASTFLRHRYPNEKSQSGGQQPFTFLDDVSIMMYCSEAPCGDASMELVMEVQEDATPWPVTVENDSLKTTLLGRGSFSQLGIVRRKPGKQLPSGENRSWTK